MVHFELASLLLMSASIVLAVKVSDIKNKEKDHEHEWVSYTYDGTKRYDNWCDYRKCRLMHTGYVSRLYLYCLIPKGCFEKL